MNKIKLLFKGASGDSFFLMFVRMVTLVFGLLMTRVLSGHFSLQEYGTYSQVLLLVTTISSMTILGMMDGINFFFCREKDEQKRNSYISTIFFLQYLISIIVSIVVITCTVPISRYFGNEALRKLIIFAAILPILQNSISLLQIMFIAIGKAKVIAIRNLLVSVIKFLAIVLACYVFDNIVTLLVFQVLTDGLQVVYFLCILRKRNCKINVLKFDKALIKEILIYCIPMAMFAVIKSLNRDSDKFVVSYFTDTTTLAIYTNASKILPFDIVMTSFCTVLLPFITRFIADKKYILTQKLYRAFLEFSCISTTILAAGAICVAPELMRFLYTEKYVANNFGVFVFVIYIVVDIFSVLNITLILSASGKTKTILFASIGTFVLNIILNIGLFYLIGVIGPAIATLVVTIIQGITILSLSAREIKSGFLHMFDWKNMALLLIELLVGIAVGSIIRYGLNSIKVNYFVILFVIYILFVGGLFLMNKKKIFNNLNIINSCKAEQ